MPPLHITLCDTDPNMIDAWKQHFRNVPEVQIRQGNILEHNAMGIVSPANSFGYMDGGIELLYSSFFGWNLEREIRKRLLVELDGELPVGQALIARTEQPDLPHLVLAPIMRIPSDISNTPNVYLAFRAVLQRVRSYNEAAEAPIESLLCPAMGVDPGQMPPERSARQMRAAYDRVVLGQVDVRGRLAGEELRHRELIR